MFSTALRTGLIRDKIKVWFMDPGWRPDDLGGPQKAPPVDTKTFKKFKTSVSRGTIIYVLIHGLGISGAALYLDKAGILMSLAGLLLACWVFLSAYSLGLLLQGIFLRKKPLNFSDSEQFSLFCFWRRERVLKHWSQVCRSSGAGINRISAPY